MYIKISKISLVWAVAFFVSLVVFNNVTDYNSNYQYINHVFKMDTTFSSSNNWRAINSTLIYHALYVFIIFIEAIIAILCWIGGLQLLKTIRNLKDFNKAKSYAILGLTLGVLLWLSAFFTIGGEWFLMWQSKDWNARAASFRILVIIAIILLYLTMTDTKEDV